MNRRHFLVAGAGGALLPAVGAFAQRQGRKYRIAFLYTVPPAENAPHLGALRERLAVHGFTDSDNLDIDARRVHPLLPGDVKSLLEEQLALKPDAIFVLTRRYADHVLKFEQSMPVVFAWVADPVMGGMVRDYAKPGGNATGVSSRLFETGVRRLEFLRELLPAAKRVGIAGVMFDSDVMELTTRLHQVAGRLGFQSMQVNAYMEKAVSAIQGAIKDGAEAILSVHVYAWRGEQVTGEQVVDLTVKQRVPVLFAEAQMAHAGGLISYGTNPLEDIRRAADMLASVLRGANPGEIPIDQASALELVVNFKAASAMGIHVPPSILARANRVIE